MTEFTNYSHGTFSWVDLPTTDAEGAKKFYTGLFGWEAVDVPAGPGRVYTMLQKNGKNAAALYQQDAQQQGMPAFWLSYISVDNVEEVVGNVAELGGTVMMPAMDVMESGRMAMIQDPTGAVVGLWQPGQHLGADICNEPGSLTWNELATHDLDKAAEFYTQLLSWGKQVTDMGNFEYTTFVVGERPNAGMMKIQAEWGDVPPNWSVYFAVENCDAAVEKAKSLGGKIEMGPQDIPNVGRFALIQDPQGAYFYAMQLAAAQ
jgi:predicted enzyme related to lactoylglutathione lyase